MLHMAVAFMGKNVAIVDLYRLEEGKLAEQLAGSAGDSPEGCRIVIFYSWNGRSVKLFQPFQLCYEIDNTFSSCFRLFRIL
jgi:hypothetical protein